MPFIGVSAALSPPLEGPAPPCACEPGPTPPRGRKRAAPSGRAASIRSCLTFGELEAAARLGLAVLLALDHTRVAGQEAAAFEHRAQVRLVPHQRLGQAVAHGAGLAGKPAAGDRADDIVLA